MIKIINFLIKLQSKLTPKNDKLGHFYYGVLYSYIGSFIYLFTGFGLSILLVPFVLGVLKEYRDYKTYKFFDLFDLIFTFANGVLLYVFLVIL